MSKDFLQNEKEIREESRETLDYLNGSGNDKGIIEREIDKLRKLSTGIL